MTNRKYTNRRYLDALEKKVLVFDGAKGLSGAKATCSVHGSPFGADERVRFSGLPRTEAGL